jgi:hypothetical protein
MSTTTAAGLRLRRRQFKLASVDRFMRQAAYDLAQHGFAHRFGCFLGSDPLDLAMFLLWPLLALTHHSQWKDTHFTGYDNPVLEALFVGK